MPDLDSKQRSKERYNRFASGYVNSESHAKGDDLAILLDMANPQPNWHMLDVATGGGHTALTFAPHVARVTASDLTPNMIAKAAQHIRANGGVNVDFTQADAENLPFADGAFDLVTCRIAPHHFPDAAKFIIESARCLKHGGIFLLQDHVLPDDENAARYVDEFERLRDPSHHRAFNHSEWTAMCTAAGLSILHQQKITKRHKFMPWAVRQGCDEPTIAKLTHMLENAPPIAAQWFAGQHIGTETATFRNHHLITVAQKL